MPVKQVLNKGRVPVKIYTEDLDARAYDQLINVSKLPIVHGHVAAMPDVHAGRGATVGSVIPTIDAIIPAAVGVDIGCGMNAVQLSLQAEDLPESLRNVRADIEAAIPVGFAQHQRRAVKASTVTAMNVGLEPILARHPGVMKMVRNFGHTWQRQLATLGGGNHFIEICLDENGAVWVMLHSGSRGIGNAIGRYFIALARKDARRNELHLPDPDLAYLQAGSEHFDDYVAAVTWAQEYARVNRREMLKLVLVALQNRLPAFHMVNEAINCHHNYVALEHHFGADVYVTRKGAIRAGLGELGIIPGSMGARWKKMPISRSADSFESSAHGAGRRMSRTEAKQRFSRFDLERQTEGIECRKDKGLVDEIPAAYKDIDTVMAHQNDLVEVVHTLRQVVCVKG